MSREDLEDVKGSFYGWEYCVERDLIPTISVRDIHIMSNVFHELDELRREIKKQTQRSSCLMCGDNAVEFRHGGYYCGEC